MTSLVLESDEDNDLDTLVDQKIDEYLESLMRPEERDITESVPLDPTMNQLAINLDSVISKIDEK
jgi:hypothetical protein